jgi:hypothetical protein
MTVLIPRDRKYSRYLFDLEARWCLERNSLNAVTGQAATFTRTSPASAIGSNGILHVAAHSEPRFQWLDLDGDSVLETPGFLLEDTRTNVVLHKRDLSNASWTKSNVTAVRDQIGIDGVANSASSIVSTLANGTVLQAITLGSSARLQSAWVKRISGAGNLQMTTDNGSTWTTVPTTTSWARATIPAQTLANPTVGFRIVTNGDKFAIDWVQNENGKHASSPIGTAADNTATETRAADALSFPLNVPPRALTVLHDAVWYVNADATTNFHSFSNLISTNPYLLGRLDGSTLQPQLQHHNGTALVTAQAAIAPTFGQRVEGRHVLQADGSVLVGASINGGAETVTGASAANALAAAWHDTTLTIGSGNGQLGYFALRTMRIAAGVQTLAYMREG